LTRLRAFSRLKATARLLWQGSVQLKAP